MAKDCTHRTLTRSRSKENSLDLPLEMVMLHPDVSSTATQDLNANGSGDGAYFDVLLPVQGGPATKSEISTVATKTTSQSPVPNAIGSGNGVYFDVLAPKQGTAVEQEQANSDNMSGDVSSANLEALFSDGDSRTNSVVISERAQSVSSVSSFGSARASPVYENVPPYHEREKSRSMSPNHSSLPSSADVREEWVLPGHREKPLHQKMASFDELALLQRQGTGEHSSLVRHTHVAGRRTTRSLEESSLHWEKQSSRAKPTVRYVNLEDVDDAICHVTSGMGRLNVLASESGHEAQHKSAATEYINVTVDEKPQKQRSSLPGSYHKEEYVNVELTNRSTKRSSRYSLGAGSSYVNMDGPVLQTVTELRRRSRAGDFVLMDFSGGGRQSEEQTDRQTGKKNKFCHARSHSCDNLTDLAEDASGTTRSRSNALTEKCSPSFRRWKLFGSRDDLMESPLEETPPTVTIRGTEGLNYVTVQHTPSPKKASSPSKEKLVLTRKSASVKISGSSGASAPDVIYMQIDPVATRAIVRTMAQRNSEIETKMKMYSNKATTLS